jgi:hypothetical protein
VSFLDVGHFGCFDVGFNMHNRGGDYIMDRKAIFELCHTRGVE